MSTSAMTVSQNMGAQSLAAWQWSSSIDVLRLDEGTSSRLKDQLSNPVLQRECLLVGWVAMTQWLVVALTAHP